MSLFRSYLTGFVVLLFGLAFAAYLLNFPLLWIAVGVAAVSCSVILVATRAHRSKQPPSL